MKLCNTCGFEIKDDDNYCGACGSKITDTPKYNPQLTQYAISPKFIQFKLGVVYFKQNKLEQAKNTFRTILKDDPKNIPAKEILEKIEHAQKQLILH